MAGNEIYIGKMLESISNDMVQLANKMTATVQAMQNVENRLEDVVKNTSQAIISVKVDAENPDMLFNIGNAAEKITVQSLNGNAGFTAISTKIRCLADGVINVNFSSITSAYSSNSKHARAAVRIGEEIFNTDVYTSDNPFSVRVNVKCDDIIEFGTYASPAAKTTYDQLTVGAGITLSWAVKENLANNPFAAL